MIWTPRRRREGIVLLGHSRVARELSLFKQGMQRQTPRSAPRGRQLGFFVPVPFIRRYHVLSADFDGSTNYLARASLTGLVDGKEGTISVWFKLDGNDGANRRILSFGASANALSCFINTANLIEIDGRNSVATQILRIRSTNTFTASAPWHHLLASWNLATAGARWLYVDGVDVTNSTVHTNDTINYTIAAAKEVGRVTGGGSPSMNGPLAELWFNPTVIDLSVQANREKFSYDSKPLDLGANGSRVTGSQPLIYLSLRPGQAGSEFGTNRGSGGNFTVNGTLNLGSTSPSGT